MGKRTIKFDTGTETIENQRYLAKKKYSIHDLNIYQPMTGAQKRFIDSWNSGTDVIFQLGCAGTGKTAMALNVSFKTILEGRSDYRKVIIIRSAVAVREQGHLPGELSDKEAVYELPYIQLINSMFKYNNSYDNLKALGLLEFTTTSYLRGQTLGADEPVIVICDEVQNMDFAELNTVFTRLGEGSCIIFCGDGNQTDLGRKSKEKSGLTEFIKIMEYMQNKNSEAVDILLYGPEDVVRSGIVRDYYIARHKLNI